MVSVAVELRDLEALRRAAHRLGWKFCEGQQTYRWVGRWYDDSPVPRELFSTEAEYQKAIGMTRAERIAFMPTVLGKCQHAIAIPGCEGEIGVIVRDGRLIPIWDYFAAGLHGVRAENGIAGLVQAYSVEAAKLEAYRQGHFVTEHAQADGNIQLRVQLP